MNVKKLLKKQSSEVMPSDSVKRRIAVDCGIEQETVTNAGGGVAVKTKRNIAISVGACCAAAVAAITCAIILIKPAVPAITPDVINFGSVSSATQFYAYSAVSVGNMLDEIDMTSVASAFAAESFDTTSTVSAEITDLQKKTLDKYAVFAAGMLGEGKITSSYTVADKEGYEFKLGIGYSDGFGSSAETVLYFNKVAGSVKIDGDEEEFAIVGELVKGNVSFPVEGKYETEKGDGETENEIEFTAYTSLDKKSYIKMEYEYESEASETESKVVVSVYENEGLTEKAKIKGESGIDASFEVDVERPSAEDNVKIKFNPFEENGNKIMHVDAWFGENEHKLIMESKPWEQGGGFDFINRGNAGDKPHGGNPHNGPADDFDDDWNDKDNKEDKEDKEDKPVAPSDNEWEDIKDKEDKPVTPPDNEWEDMKDREDIGDYPVVPPFGLGFWS